MNAYLSGRLNFGVRWGVRTLPGTWVPAFPRITSGAGSAGTTDLRLSAVGWDEAMPNPGDGQDTNLGMNFKGLGSELPMRGICGMGPGVWLRRGFRLDHQRYSDLTTRPRYLGGRPFKRTPVCYRERYPKRRFS